MKSVLLQIRRSEAGAIEARRTDGKPLTEADRETARALAEQLQPEPRAWVIKAVRHPAGEIRAVQICSAFLQHHLWLIFDESSPK